MLCRRASHAERTQSPIRDVAQVCSVANRMTSDHCVTPTDPHAPCYRSRGLRPRRSSANGDGVVTVDELLQAVIRALNGC